MLDPELESRIEALIHVGRHADAADLCAAHDEYARAGDLYAAVWRWPEAIAITEQHDLLDRAFAHALTAEDRAASARLLAALAERPEQASRAAVHAEAKGRTLDAARLREAAGELPAAAELFERAGELRDAARCRLALGQAREAGMLFEKRLREDDEDRESALALGRILAQFGRFEHAVRALQRAADDAAHQQQSLRLMIACFAALGLEEAAGSRLDALRVLDPAQPPTVAAFLEAELGDARGLLAMRATSQDDRWLAGRYRVLSPLGAGATGRVLLAHDAFHDREVAVKVLNVGGRGRDAFARFVREARVAAGIAHPNVIEVYEFNPDGPFLVMEHMAGGTLADRIEGPDGPRALPAADTHHLARSVLSALEAVHRRGVVHRDLKPANVFYGRTGDVKLGDFGVAHLSDLGATLTGAMVGTLPYMTPEQITGSQRPNASTDLYAFGVILFRCLTGRLPFEGPDFVAQHLEEAPPRPSAVAPWIGDGFDTLISELLDKDPETRPGSATALLDRLRGLPWGAVEAPPPRARNVARALSEPPPAPTDPDAERYRLLHGLADGARVAHDELLDRDVELRTLGPGDAERLRAFARADHPHLQAVYEVDEALSRAVLERPTGAPWITLSPTDARRRRAIPELRAALEAVHRAGLAHGRVDAEHIVVGASRACLRLALHIGAASPEADSLALDALG